MDQKISCFQNTDKIFSWTSKGMLQKSIKNLSIRDNSFAPMWVGKYQISTVKLNRICLKLDRVSFIHGNVVNLYISYELG